MTLEERSAQLEAEQAALLAVEVQDVYAVGRCPELAARGTVCHPGHMLSQLLNSRSTVPGDLVRRHRSGEGRDISRRAHRVLYGLGVFCERRECRRRRRWEDESLLLYLDAADTQGV
jgi:hypothetical protein